MRNKFAEMSHKYCSVGLNLGMAKYTEAEQQRFETCLSKYGQAFNIYKEEQNVYFNTINEIKSQQGDIYAKFNEYDKYWNINNDLTLAQRSKNPPCPKRENQNLCSSLNYLTQITLQKI